MNRSRLLSLSVLTLLLVSSLPLSFAEPFDPLNPYFQGDAPLILERGINYVVSDLGGNKRSWESAPQWVSDGSKYVPYIYFRDTAKKCYSVQVGFVAARVYDTGIVELYDPALSEVRVKGESWEVWSAGKKATLVAPITWDVITNSSGVFITRQQTTSKPNGILIIIYSFVVGASLKNTVMWTSFEGKSVTVQVKQVDLMDFDKVTTESGTSTTSKSEKSGAYLFGYGLKDFWLLMDQYQMVYDAKSLNPMPPLLTEKCLQTGEIDFAGKKVTYTFGDWTLATGETLEIDPSPYSSNNPTEDDDIHYAFPDYLKSSGQGIYIGKYGTVVYRGYAQWDTSSISNTATITNTLFKYNCFYHGSDAHIHAMASKPSTATTANIWTDIGDGTVYADVAGFPVQNTNQEIDLGATADSDLQGLLSSDWFAIGLQADSEAATYSNIRSEENGSADPKPTLYVEYTEGSTDYPRAGAKSLTLAKAATRSIGFVRGDSLSLTLAKAGTRLIGFVRAAEVINGFALANAGTRLIGFARATSGAFTLANAGTNLMGWVRGAAQTLTFKEDATKALAIIRAGAQGLTFASAGTRLAEFIRAAAQGVTLGDSATRIVGMMRGASQGFTLASSGSMLLGFARSAAQGLTLTSAGTSVIGWVRGTSAALTLASTGSRVVGLVRGATQGLTLAEAGTAVLGFIRATTQGLTLTSAGTRLIEYLRDAAQGLTLANAGARVIGYIRAAAQGITLTSAGAKLVGWVRAASAGLTLTNAATRLVELYKTSSQSLSLTSAASKLINLIRGATQALTLSSAADRVMGVIRGAAQGIVVASGATRIYEAMRGAAQGLTLASSGARILGFIRDAAQGLTLANAGIRLVDYLRTATQGITLANTGAYLVDYLRAATVGITLDSLASRVVFVITHFVAAVGQTLTMTVDAARQIGFLRAAGQSLVTALSGVGYLAVHYLANVGVGIILKSFGWGVKNLVTGGISYWLIIVLAAFMVFYLMIKRR